VAVRVVYAAPAVLIRRLLECLSPFFPVFGEAKISIYAAVATAFVHFGGFLAASVLDA